MTGEHGHQRAIPSTKQWRMFAGIKIGPCRCCEDPAMNGRMYGRIQLHHIVPLDEGGTDVPDNVVPLCPDCHEAIHKRDPIVARVLVLALTDAEYLYAVEHGGLDVWERVYGLKNEQGKRNPKGEHDG